MQMTDWTGRRRGRWTVIRLEGRNPARWLCRCDCGTERILSAPAVRLASGCGCARAAENESRATHRLIGTKEYHAWTAMKSRCSDANHPAFANYGGRGITVCDRWRDSFEAFLADVGRAPSPGLSLDRYPNNDGNYEPGNVRWATRSEQTSNQRMTEAKLAHNRKAARARGIAKYGVCLTEEARAAGINRATLNARLRYGWTLERALSEPVRSAARRVD